MDHTGLLRHARARASLSQEELARRARVRQQAVERYESGASSPTLRTFDRLLVACGLRARIVLEPYPVDLDAEVRALLALAPASRLPLTQTVMLHLLGELEQEGVAFLVVGSAAARLYGAPVGCQETEIAVCRQTVPVETLGAVLRSAHAEYRDERERGDRVRLPEQLAFGHATYATGFGRLVVRLAEGFADLARGAGRVADVPVAAPGDVGSWWDPHSFDHEVLARAVDLGGLSSPASPR